MFEYFLDPRNHRPGTPLDMISYHFYATPSADESARCNSSRSSTRRTGSSPRALHRSHSAAAVSGHRNRGERDRQHPAGDPNLKIAIPDSYWNLSELVMRTSSASLPRWASISRANRSWSAIPPSSPACRWWMVDRRSQCTARVLELLKTTSALATYREDISSSASSAVYALGMMSPKGERKLLL